MSAAVKPSRSSYTGIIVWFKNIDPKCCFPFVQQKVSVRIISAAWLRHDLINVRETEYETEDWWDPSLKTHIITPAQSKDKGHNMSHNHKTLDFMSRMFSPRPLPWLYKIPVYFSQSSLESVVGQCSFGTFLFDFYCCLNIFSLQKLKSLHLFFGCSSVVAPPSNNCEHLSCAQWHSLWIYCSLFWHSLTVEKLENDTHTHIHTKKEAASLLSGRFICSSVLMFWK